ncbi:MAG: hypothetical protein U9N45_04645, partial [Gemmatimonadota bacterium]|nr:hypothetical protein [Gemmatimonadota bacterium]
SPGPEPSGINTQLKAHAYGKGRAVTLGFLLDNYPEWVRDGVAGKARKLAGSALETAGVRPPVRLETPDRGPVSGVTTASFTNGESTLLGILRSNEGELNRLDFSAILPNGAAHVYDLRKGTYLGYTDRIHLELSTGEPALFALLPRPPGRLTVEAPGKVAPGGSVHLSLSLDEPMELHDVALVEVVTPEGKRHELYSTRIDLDNSSGELTFPLALDDQSGRWMIRVTEVISGRRGEAFFTVSK